MIQIEQSARIEFQGPLRRLILLKLEENRDFFAGSSYCAAVGTSLRPSARADGLGGSLEAVGAARMLRAVALLGALAFVAAQGA